ncbi:myb-like protein A [Onthophagus taurus]|uniref:myb-like protein A n=1 Tax=Onthophagus taurus TaxID=166361 RepID=UPI0039BDC1E4
MYPNLPPILLYISLAQPPDVNYPFGVPFQHGPPMVGFPQIPYGYNSAYYPFNLGVSSPIKGNCDQVGSASSGLTPNMEAIRKDFRGPKERSSNQGARSMRIEVQNTENSQPVVKMKLDNNGKEMAQTFQLPFGYQPQNYQTFGPNQNNNQQYIPLVNVADKHAPLPGARSMNLAVQYPGNSQPIVEMKLDSNGKEMVQSFQIPSLDPNNNQFRPFDYQRQYYQTFWPNQYIPVLNVANKNTPFPGARSMSLAVQKQLNSQPVVEMKLDNNGKEMAQTLQIPSIHLINNQFRPLGYQPQYYQTYSANQNYNQQNVPLLNVADKLAPFPGARSMSLAVQNQGNSPPVVEMKLDSNGKEMAQTFQLPSIDLINNQLRPLGYQPQYYQTYGANQNFNQQNVPLLNPINNQVRPFEYQRQYYQKFWPNENINQQNVPVLNVANKNTPFPGARSMNFAVQNQLNSQPVVEMKLDNNGKEMAQTLQLPSIDIINNQFRPFDYQRQYYQTYWPNHNTNQQNVPLLNVADKNTPLPGVQEEHHQHHTPNKNISQQNVTSFHINLPAFGARAMTLTVQNSSDSRPSLTMKLDNDSKEMILNLKYPSTDLLNQFGHNISQNPERNQQQPQSQEHQNLSSSDVANNLPVSGAKFINRAINGSYEPVQNSQQQPQEEILDQQGDSPLDVVDKASPISGARSISHEQKAPKNSGPEAEKDLDQNNQQNQNHESTHQKPPQFDKQNISDIPDKNSPSSGARSKSLDIKNPNSPPHLQIPVDNTTNGNHGLVQNNQQQPQEGILDQQGDSPLDVADKASPLSGARSISHEQKTPENSEPEAKKDLDHNNQQNQHHESTQQEPPQFDKQNIFDIPDKNSPSSGARSKSLDIKNLKSPPHLQIPLDNTTNGSHERVQNDQQQPQEGILDQQGDSPLDVADKASPISGGRSISHEQKTPENFGPEAKKDPDQNNQQNQNNESSQQKPPQFDKQNISDIPDTNSTSSGAKSKSPDIKNPNSPPHLQIPVDNTTNGNHGLVQNNQQHPQEGILDQQGDSPLDVADKASPISGARSISHEQKTPDNSESEAKKDLDQNNQQNQNHESTQQEPPEFNKHNISDIPDKKSPSSGARSMSLDIKNPNSGPEVEMKLDHNGNNMTQNFKLPPTNPFYQQLPRSKEANETDPNHDPNYSEIYKEKNPEVNNEGKLQVMNPTDKPELLNSLNNTNTTRAGSGYRNRTATIQFANQLHVYSYNTSVFPTIQRFNIYNQTIMNKRRPDQNKGNYPIKQYAANARRQDTRGSSKQKSSPNNVKPKELGTVDDKVDSFQLALITILDRGPKRQSNNKETESNSGQVGKDCRPCRAPVAKQQNKAVGTKPKEAIPVEDKVDGFKIALMTILQQKEVEKKVTPPPSLKLLRRQDPEKFKYALFHLLNN